MFVGGWDSDTRRPRQTREASPQWGVPKASAPSLLARKGERNPLQGFRATIERTVSNPATSTPRDIVNQCSRGFAFPADFPLFSGLQPRGLQQVAKALVWQAEKITSGNFRIFPAFSALKMSTLIFLVTIPDRWTICFSFVKIITEKSNG